LVTEMVAVLVDSLLSSYVLVFIYFFLILFIGYVQLMPHLWPALRLTFRLPLCIFFIWFDWYDVL